MSAVNPFKAAALASSFAHPSNPENKAAMQACFEAVSRLKARGSGRVSPAPRKPRDACFYGLPESFKKGLIRKAGLQAELMARQDRLLSETEKAAIRAAAAEIRHLATIAMSI